MEVRRHAGSQVASVLQVVNNPGSFQLLGPLSVLSIPVVNQWLKMTASISHQIYSPGYGKEEELGQGVYANWILRESLEVWLIIFV